MFHEVWLSFGISWRANLVAMTHRMCALIEGRSVQDMDILELGEILRGARAPVSVLPVPSNVVMMPLQEDCRLRQQFCRGRNKSPYGPLRNR